MRQIPYTSQSSVTRLKQLVIGIKNLRENNHEIRYQWVGKVSEPGRTRLMAANKSCQDKDIHVIRLLLNIRKQFFCNGVNVIPLLQSQNYKIAYLEKLFTFLIKSS